METQIQFKLMRDEKRRIKEEALKIGLGMSPFVRSIILKHIHKSNKEVDSQ